MFSHPDQKMGIFLASQYGLTIWVLYTLPMFYPGGVLEDAFFSFRSKAAIFSSRSSRPWMRMTNPLTENLRILNKKCYNK
jgi:hypothetical protein